MYLGIADFAPVIEIGYKPDPAGKNQDFVTTIRDRIKANLE